MENKHETAVKRKNLVTVHVLFTVHTRSWSKDKLKLLVLKVEVEADKLKLNVQKYGTMAILQFPSTARVFTQEWTAADIEGWRLAIYRSFLSTKKAWIWNTISSLQTSKFIKQSQYQKILLQYQIIFSDHLFKSITNYSLSFS